MGDLSAEPSMEEILSSIKRIIAEEGEGAPRQRRPQPQPARIAPPPVDRREPNEVLELSEPMPTPGPMAERALERQLPQFRAPAVEAAAAAPPPVAAPAAPAAEAPVRAPDTRAPENIVSQQAAAASRGALDTLSRLVVKPEGVGPGGIPTGETTLEGLVREMLRPMLREWLDSRLPDMVEAMVAREIERITGSR